MLRVLIYASLLSSACSVASSLPVPKAGLIDPFAEVIEVPADTCPNLQGWYAISERGMRALVDADIDREKECKIKISEAQTAARIAEIERDQAQKALERASFWAKWGLPIGFAGGALVTTLGVIIFKGLEAAYAR